MPISVVIGGQYGSEGKGKVAHHFVKEFKAVAAVKVGGTNAGHTVYDAKGQKHIFRVLPTACVEDNVALVIGPGSYFQPELLFAECEAVKLDMSRLFIHPNAGIIMERMQEIESWSPAMGSIGSTMSGTGEATKNRVARDGQFVRACEIPELDNYLCDTTALMTPMLNRGDNIIIEGCQGFGLSYYHTPQYPFATSRDTTAAAFVGDAGLSVFDVEHIIQCLRTYEIRVAGSSGPMKYETTWEQVTADAHSEQPICEYTSVSRKVRRVGRFDPELVKRSTMVNKPDITVMNFMDYIGEEDWHFNMSVMGPNKYKFVNWVESQTGCKITHVGFSGDDVRAIEYAAPF